MVKEFILASRPSGVPDPKTFQMNEKELPSLRDGEVRVQGLYYSVDPYMRGRMNEGRSYVPPYELGRPIEGGVVAKVVSSKSDILKVGDLVTGIMPWATETNIAARSLQKIDSRHAEHASLYLGLLGMPGLTAYFGLLEIGKPKAGETVVVSGAAGAVGTAVGQIAKIKDCHVVGIAGSEEKTNLLKKEFRFDQAVNYKTNLEEGLAIACPRGVDVYFDNVGGEVSDATLQLMNDHGRISVCGQIALYNAKSAPMGPRPQPLLLTRKLLMQGFIVYDFQAKYAEGTAALTKWYEQGLLKPMETVVDGFDQLPTALIGLFKGENTGKMIVRIQ